MEDFYADHVTSEAKTIKKGRKFYEKSQIDVIKS